jgi:hypothetical protein
LYCNVCEPVVVVAVDGINVADDEASGVGFKVFTAVGFEVD